MIIQNVLSNALKYTPDGGEVSISSSLATQNDIKSAHIDSTRPHILLTIQDTGYGIPKEQQAKIYTKMFRADNVHVLDVEGTGLGLYIVKEVVKKLHGRIWFESVENKGTAFHIMLPIKTKSTKV
jgi:two-component system sensor histidine kinase VicK